MPGLILQLLVQDCGDGDGRDQDFLSGSPARKVGHELRAGRGVEVCMSQQHMLETRAD